MPDYTYGPDAAKAGVERDVQQEYGAALSTIMGWRRFFLLLLVLSLLGHVGLYCAAKWTDAFKSGLVAVGDPGSLASTTAGVPSLAQPGSSSTRELGDSLTPAPSATAAYQEWIRLATPVVAILGRISCVLLALSYLLAANVALAGRVGGVRGCVAGFFWMLLVLAVLMPWEQWLAASPDGVRITGAYAPYERLITVPSEFPDQTSEALHYARFLAYPLLVLIAALLADSACARGCRMAREQVNARVRARAI